MKRKRRKPTPDQRLQDIAHILARGIIRMKDDGLLLTNRWEEDNPSLRKPSKPVNQQVSG
jgi:hypothetical protein